MIKVKITKDGFVNGRTRVPKGTIIEVAPPIARYIVRNDDGQIIDSPKEKTPDLDELLGTDEPEKKAPAKKKGVYKTRVMKAK